MTSCYTYLSSGCVQGCIIPFISRYKLSNSTPFGFGSAEFTGMHTPSADTDYKYKISKFYSYISLDLEYYWNNLSNFGSKINSS